MTDSNRTMGIPTEPTPKDITPRTSTNTTPKRKARRSTRPPSHHSRRSRAERMPPSFRCARSMTRNRKAQKRRSMTPMNRTTQRTLITPMTNLTTNRAIQTTTTIPKTRMPQHPAKMAKSPAIPGRTAASAAAVAVGAVVRRKLSRVHRLAPSAGN